MRANNLNVRKTYLAMVDALDEIEKALKKRGGEDQETINENGIPLLVESLYDQLDELKADRAALAACEKERYEYKAIVDSWNEDNGMGPPPTHAQYVGICEALEKAEAERYEARAALKDAGKEVWQAQADRDKAEADRDALAAALRKAYEPGVREAWMQHAAAYLRDLFRPRRLSPDDSSDYGEQMQVELKELVEEYAALDSPTLPADVAELLARCEK
jgi:hypothetical protein